ncbi:MAG: type II secretion system protein [Sulfuricurvum sp.]
MKRNAFTMIELIFVIVVLGILAAVAIPRMTSAIDDANIGKAKSDVAALRSAIASERQARILQGNAGYITHLDQGVTQDAAGVTIFDGNGSGVLLQYGIITGTNEGEWLKTGADQYTFKSAGASVAFDYNATTGRFTCDPSSGTTANDNLCKQIIY